MVLPDDKFISYFSHLMLDFITWKVYYGKQLITSVHKSVEVLKKIRISEENGYYEKVISTHDDNGTDT